MLFDRPHLVTPQTHAAYCQWVESRLSSPGVDVAEVPKTDAQDGDPEPGEDGYYSSNGLLQVAENAVLIKVYGTLVMHPEDIAMSECGCPMERLNQKIDAAEADPRIEKVFYDFRTPGGSITGIPETGRKIQQSRKETIAFCDSQCCSGGIWLAEQCQKFYATPSSRIGSVGVYTLRMDLTQQMKKDGVKVKAIFAGKYKLMGAYFQPLAADEESILQKQIDKIYDQFKFAMTSFRTPSDDSYGNGLVFDGEQAAEMGLTDGCVESLSELIEQFTN